MKATPGGAVELPGRSQPAPGVVDLRWIFYIRGLAYKLKGEQDCAIADYDEAIRLEPKYTAAFLFAAEG